MEMRSQSKAEVKVLMGPDFMQQVKNYLRGIPQKCDETIKCCYWKTTSLGIVGIPFGVPVFRRPKCGTGTPPSLI